MADSSIETVVEKLSYEELKAIERDLSVNLPLIRQKVSERIQEMERGEKVCAVCGSIIEDSPKTFTIIFGPKGVQKKATLCAHDCLEYFVRKLKK